MVTVSAGGDAREVAAGMRGWRFWKKGPGAGAAEGSDHTTGGPAAGEDEWAFLRRQPDHDADEMASVHGAPAAEALRAVAPPVPAVPARPTPLFERETVPGSGAW